MTTPQEKLKEIESRLSSATPGPWSKNLVRDENLKLNRVCTVRSLPIYSEYGSSTHGEDLDFIVNAPKDISWLIDRIKTLEEALTSIASLDYPQHSKKLHWKKLISHDKCAEVTSQDIGIARKAVDGLTTEGSES